MKSWLLQTLFPLKQKKILFGLPILLALVIATTIFFASNHNITVGKIADRNTAITGINPQAKLLGNASETNKRTDLGILLLGYGGPGHSGGFLTDVIQVLHIDFAKQKVSLISIPRDLWVTTKDGKSGKINEAFSLGMNANNFGSQPGVAVVKQMAAQVTGVPIDYFIGIDFVGLQRAIGEKLHGIDVQVSQTLDDPWYPIRGKELETCGLTAEEVAEVSRTYSGFELEKQFPCRYDHIHFAAGNQRMEGGDVLAFVRSRHGSGAGDFARSKRQHEVLQAIVGKLLKIDAFADAVSFFQSLQNIITTDISVEVVTKLSPQILQATQFPRKTTILSTENVLTTSKSSTGQFILLPKTGAGDWQLTQDFVTNSN